MSKPDPRKIDKQLEAALVAARKGNSLTQTELAKRLNKPQSFVSKYETGELKLTVGNFVVICKAIGIEPADVLDKL